MLGLLGYLPTGTELGKIGIEFFGNLVSKCPIVRRKWTPELAQIMPPVLKINKILHSLIIDQPAYFFQTPNNNQNQVTKDNIYQEGSRY